MKVKELIAHLQKFDGDLNVVKIPPVPTDEVLVKEFSLKEHTEEVRFENGLQPVLIKEKVIYI